jgi:hypothetical protein
MTLSDKLHEELAAAKAEVARVEAVLAAIPSELSVLEEEVVTRIKAFFGRA